MLDQNEITKRPVPQRTLTAGGSPAVAKPSPMGFPRSLARPGTTAAEPAAGAGPAIPRPSVVPDQYNYTGFARTLSARPASTPAATSQPSAGQSGPAVARPQPSVGQTPTLARPARNLAGFNLKPGDVNTFTGSDGVTRAVPGLLNAGSDTGAAPTSGFQRGLTTEPATFREAQIPGGGMGANIPVMDDERKRQMREGDFRWAMRGARTRSARQALADAYVAGEQTRGAERRSEMEGLTAENIAAGRNATDIARTNVEGQLATRRLNAETANAAADRDTRLEEARITRRLQPPTMLDDGTLGQIGDNGTFAPITGADGKPVRGMQSVRQTGDLTGADVVKAYTDQRNALLGADAVGPQEQQRLLAELDSGPLGQRYRAIVGAGSGEDGATATPAAQPQAAKAAPKVGDVQRGYRFKGGDPASPDSWEQVTP